MVVAWDIHSIMCLQVIDQRAKYTWITTLGIMILRRFSWCR